MKYSVEMGSGVMIYIPSSIKIGSGIQNLIGSILRKDGDCISLVLFFQNKESTLKRITMTQNLMLLLEAPIFWFPRGPHSYKSSLRCIFYEESYVRELISFYISAT
jgi:hypothetical protein